jgi:hypothetical protein
MEIYRGYIRYKSNRLRFNYWDPVIMVAWVIITLIGLVLKAKEQDKQRNFLTLVAN